jgi:hypothetical protein
VNPIRHANTPIEPLQIRATPKQHMLAVVDNLAHAWMQIRRSPPAQIPAPLNKPHSEACLRKRARSAHPRNPTANHGDALTRSGFRLAQSRFHLHKTGLPSMRALKGHGFSRAAKEQFEFRL